MTEQEVKQLSAKVAAVASTLTHLTVDDKLSRRYLIAFKTVDTAYEKILATNKWKEDFGTDKLTSETPGVKQIAATRVSVVLDHTDHLGRPIAVVFARNHNIMKRNMDDMSLYIVYTLELLVNKCVPDGPDNGCIIFDMTNFSMMCMDYSAIKNLFDVMTDHYPERLGVCLCVNAPLIFNACWIIIRAWLDERTASKIKFIKMEDLKDYLDPKIFPTG